VSSGEYKKSKSGNWRKEVRRSARIAVRSPSRARRIEILWGRSLDSIVDIVGRAAHRGLGFWRYIDGLFEDLPPDDARKPCSSHGQERANFAGRVTQPRDRARMTLD